MADYTPVYVPSKVGTFTTSAIVTGGDALVVTGSATVAKAGASATNVIGVAAQDTASGSRVSVYMRGIVHESVNEGGVTAGDQLVSSGVAGKQVKTAIPSSTPATEPAVYDAAHTVADILVARCVIGVALTSAADGLKCRWMEY
jgi:hypothetical protein